MYNKVESLTDIDTHFLKQLWITRHDTTCTLWNVKLRYCIEKNLLLNLALKPVKSVHCSCCIFYIPKSVLQSPK